MSSELRRSLGPKETLALVVGTVIGTGVFLKAAVMAQSTGSSVFVLGAWAIAGVLSLAGAFCYAELGSLMPQAGGEYVFLREAYGDLAGFLFGWMRFWIGTPGSIAAYGVAAATFLGGLLPLHGYFAKTSIAILFIGTFSLINCRSVLFGGKVQWLFTLLKIAMIVGLTFAIFSVGRGGTWTHFSVSSHWRGWSSFGSAIIAALWAYDGWNNMPMAAGEVRDPARSIPRALGLGMLIVIVLYALANIAYFYALPLAQVAASSSNLHPDALPVATQAAQSALGGIAVAVLSVAFVLSAFGSMNGTILSGARVPYAMARSGLFFSKLGYVSPETQVPVGAILAQMIIASVLAASGSFDQLTDYVIFAAWIFYSLSAAAVIVLRVRKPELARPFRTPLYPWLPIIFVGCGITLLINTVMTAPRESGIGLAFILLGIPAFFWFRKRGKGQAA